MLATRLTPHLAQKTRHFVLSLWKFLAFSLVSSKNQYSNDDIENAKLRGQAQLKAKQSGKWDPSLVSLLANEPRNESEVEKEEELPPEELKLDERRAIYDYVAEKARLNASKSAMNMGELLAEATEDFQRVKAKLQPKEASVGKTYNEQMAIMRDYKRRRQSYRAKNTRITKRTPTQILRDLIDVRMEILAPQSSERKRQRRRRHSGERRSSPLS